ncbi:MAG: UDP-glucose 6-dehydrogenase [Firmicutes bacterium HGW-Firmicutes-8]|nr:MAG: UDP-glucose 6-dehydrogenase [Firmicutes bacterium HGW-Firmicutes-8]
MVTFTCFAEKGNSLICVDNNPEKIKMLENNIMPIYEPGLKELVKKNQDEGRISFTTDLPGAVQKSDVIFIAVGTPSLSNGEADLQYIEAVAREIGQAMNGYKIVVDKSTVPVGTGDRVRKIISESQTGEYGFDVVSAPEFLREGCAVGDTLNPDRIIIGTSSKKAAQIMDELHKPFNAPIVITDVRSAEMIKYASNAFLATKISFINEIANICEKVGADVTEVARGMGYDKRIGNQFLMAGIGYGGSCFPKDTKALIQIAGNADYDFELLKSVIKVNQIQRYKPIKKLISILGELQGRTVGILGLAFKPNTDDMREAPSVEIITELKKLGAGIKAYDPVAGDEARKVIKDIEYCSDPYETMDGADAVILVTEWEEFKNLDLDKMKKLLNIPLVIDGRNVFDPAEMQAKGFIYTGVGRRQIAYLTREYRKEAAAAVEKLTK